MAKQVIFFGINPNDRNHLEDLVYTELDSFNETSIMQDAEVTTFGWTITNTLNLYGVEWLENNLYIQVRIWDIDTGIVTKEVTYDRSLQMVNLNREVA